MLPANVQIAENIGFNLHGFSGTAKGGQSTETAVQLMDRMWPIVKSNGLKNKGLNVWVYEPGNAIFVGVELLEIPAHGLGLQQKKVFLERCATGDW